MPAKKNGKNTIPDVVSLWFLIYGDRSSRLFPIEIERNRLVVDLRELIKGNRSPRFDRVPANCLDLWKVELPKTRDRAPQTPELTDEDELDPACTIGEYFPGAPPANTIHIIVKADTDTLTETQLLALVPPSIAYIAVKQSKTTEHSPWALTPDSVNTWEDFKENANLMAVDNTTPQFDTPPFKRFKASEEENVRVALEMNVLSVLSETIGVRQLSKKKKKKEEFYRSSILENIKGSPDFVLLAGDNFLLPIEVKNTSILPNDNIVKALVSEDTPVCNSIGEIFGCMAHNERCYGVLSTYDKTWFLWRPNKNPGSLLISGVVKDIDTNPTLLRCFAYMMSLARQSFECPFPPSLPQTLEDDPESPEEKDDDNKDSTYQHPKGLSSGSGKGGQGSSRGDAGNN